VNASGNPSTYDSREDLELDESRNQYNTSIFKRDSNIEAANLDGNFNILFPEISNTNQSILQD